jgi:SPP1 gp7 family putative phage head morphogenesis protein
LQIGPFSITKSPKVYELEVDNIPPDGKQVSFAESPYWDKWWYLPYNPADLYQQKGDYSLYDNIRTDDQVSSVLSLKKIITLNSAWEIQCENPEISDYIYWALDRCLSDTFTKKLYEILSAMDYGFSITEKIVSTVDYEGRTMLAFTDLKTRAPHSFEFRLDPHGDMQEILQRTSRGQISLPIDKFMLFAYQKEFDNPYGESELNKGVYRAWVSKNAIIKFWNMYLERFGMPTVVGKLPRGAGEGDKNRFKNIIKNIQAKSGMTIPDDFTVELLQVAKGAGEYEAAIDKYNQMIARKMLIPDLLGFSGGKTSGGSYALGKEQFDIFYTTINYIRNQIERLVNKHIINPLVNWNFGPNNEAYFCFSAVDEKQKTENLNLWLEAVKTGKVPATTESIQWYLEQVGAPAISEEDLDEIQEEKDEMAAAISGVKDDKSVDEAPADKSPVMDDSETGETDEQDNIERDEEAELTGSEAVREYEQFFRPLTEFEQAANLTKIDRDMSKIEEQWTNTIGDFYMMQINALIQDIKQQNIVEKRRIEKINKLTLRYQSKAEKMILDMVKESYDYGKESVSKDVKKYVYETEIANLDAEEVATWMAEYAFYISSKDGQIILDTVRPILLDGIRNGSGIKTLTSQILAELEGFDPKINPWRAANIARTTIAKAFNEARLQEWQEISEYIGAFQYSAIRDSRTSALCNALDGKIFKPDEAQYYNPPNHYQCRSVLIPIFIDQQYELSKMPATKQVDGDFMELA